MDAQAGKVEGAIRAGSRIAVVGGGIAGLGAAWLLSRRHEVTLFEQAPQAGGHAHTVSVPLAEGAVPVDTGFIVYNERNYPNLAALFTHLDVPTMASDMSFGVSLAAGALEYAGSDVYGLFAQRRNLLRPRFWRMLADIRRFYREAQACLAGGSAEQTIGELVAAAGYSAAFVDDHLMPMAAAIWSASRDDIRAYPARDFIRFFANHGLLSLDTRPRWRTVAGGSREYVRRLLASADLRLLTGVAVTAVGRRPGHAWVACADGSRQRYDAVVMAVHADQALALLADATPDERRVLGAFRSSDNQVHLHSDPRFMPRRRAAWSSWNYIEPQGGGTARAPCVSYWMNRLQGLTTRRDLFVTLNPPQAPRTELQHGRYHYRHPIFTPATAVAQAALHRIQGGLRTWFCGAWCGHGFHEDGLQAGLWVAERLGARRPWAAPFDRVPAASAERPADAA